MIRLVLLVLCTFCFSYICLLCFHFLFPSVHLAFCFMLLYLFFCSFPSFQVIILFCRFFSPSSLTLYVLVLISPFFFPQFSLSVLSLSTILITQHGSVSFQFLSFIFCFSFPVFPLSLLVFPLCDSARCGVHQNYQPRNTDCE